MNRAGTPLLRVGRRLRLRVVEAVEDFALSAIPRGTLRRQLLERVDRELQRISPRT